MTQAHDLPHSLTITPPKQSISDEMNEKHSMNDLEGPGAIDPPLLYTVLFDWLGTFFSCLI